MSGTLHIGLTIPELARRAGKHRSVMLRHLMALREKDLARGSVTWIYRSGPRTWRVNLSRLRRAHPEMHDCEDAEALDARLTRLELDQDAQGKAIRALRGQR